MGGQLPLSLCTLLLLFDPHSGCDPFAGWTATNMGIFFGLLKVAGLFRVDPKDEEEGLDHSYHGGSAYGETKGEYKPNYVKVRCSRPRDTHATTCTDECKPIVGMLISPCSCCGMALVYVRRSGMLIRGFGDMIPAERGPRFEDGDQCSEGSIQCQSSCAKGRACNCSRVEVHRSIVHIILMSRLMQACLQAL